MNKIKPFGQFIKESTGKLVSKWIQNVKLVEKKTEKKKLKSFKSTVRNMAAVPCPICNDIHAGACPQDGRMPFDPMSSVGVQNG